MTYTFTRTPFTVPTSIVHVFFYTQVHTIVLGYDTNLCYKKNTCILYKSMIYNEPIFKSHTQQSSQNNQQHTQNRISEHDYHQRKMNGSSMRFNRIQQIERTYTQNRYTPMLRYTHRCLSTLSFVREIRLIFMPKPIITDNTHTYSCFIYTETKRE